MSDEVEQDPLRQVPDVAPTPERLTQSVELRRQMENALNNLTPAERIAFVMRHCDGCGIEEIAAALKSNSGAAKNTVFRAVHKLRQMLQPQFAPRATARAMGTES
jgi:RNA polymerase sigma-70 factor (ECF subfamily)